MSAPSLADAVARAARRAWPGATVGELTPLPGGRSGVTLATELRRPSREPVRIVVKAAPDGRPAKGRHDVARQARILSALAGHDGVVVPKVLLQEAGPPAFFVMEHCAGEAVEPVLDPDGRPPDLVRDRALAAARMLAALHGAPRAFDEPVAPAGELRRWTATASAVDASLAPGALDLAELLGKKLPPEGGRDVLVHGDYRLGNLVFADRTITGLIDWEIWGVTKPGIDLGWFLVFCDAGTFPGVGRPVDGMPAAPELVAAYREAGGAEVEHLAWYEAFGRFKMAAIMAHNLRRHREGRHVDPYQERLPATIARLIETGAERLRE